MVVHSCLTAARGAPALVTTSHPRDDPVDEHAGDAQRAGGQRQRPQHLLVPQRPVKLLVRGHLRMRMLL